MNVTVVVCVKERVGSDASCAGTGSVELANLLEQAFAARGWSVPVKRLMCFGRCNEGPNIRVAPGGAFFTRMNRERLDEVIEAVRVAMSATE
ncbi:MAG: (2Fe-2S) ferredoxin domain-containing protein [Magnetococcales bacterium]|nr:(2Fe-2S) ferredoxin domain-containing protein [Magnetococcales bacterium]